VNVREKPKWTDIVTVIVTCVIAFAALYSAWLFQGQLMQSTDFFRTDERAWLSVEVGEKNGKFGVVMKNTGKTPALNILYFASFVGGPRGVLPQISAPNTQELHHFLVAPGDVQTADNFELNYLQAFNLGGDRNYVQGDISYDDIFGKTHHTVYCYWTEPPPVRQPGVFPSSTFTMCGEHNKMD
jgi:hypothetical protein